MRWRRTWAAIAVASLVIVAGACSDDSNGAAPWEGDDAAGADPDGDPTGATDPPDLPLVAPIDGVAAATLVVAGGADTVTVRSDDLGDDLYRIAPADGSDLVPGVVITDAGTLDDDTLDGVLDDDTDGDDQPVDGDERDDEGDPVDAGSGPVIEVHVEDRGDGGPAVLQIEVAASVRWSVRLSGGAGEARVDASAGGVEQLDVTAGVSRLETWLPDADAPVTVTETGGASQVVVHAPDDTPVRVDVRGGAGSVDVDGEVRSGVQAGTVVAPPGWEATAGRIDVVLVGGVSSVVVDRAD